MHRDYKIVSVTPAGRKRYLEILVPHLLAQRHIIDKHRFWVNTTVPEDVAYIEEMVERHPDFFELERLEDDRPDIPGVKRNILIHQFFKHCCDPDTIYVRFDDDVCWIAQDCVENLIDFRLDHPEPFLVYPSIVMNAYCACMQQRNGAFPTLKANLPYDTFGPVWKDGETAAIIHHWFLYELTEGRASTFHIPDCVLKDFERISINCICWNGRDFAEFNGEVGKDEEQWLATTQPRALGRPNMICGSAIVVHFAFHPQREWIEKNTNLLELYRLIAPRIG